MKFVQHVSLSHSSQLAARSLRLAAYTPPDTPQLCLHYPWYRYAAKKPPEPCSFFLQNKGKCVALRAWRMDGSLCWGLSLCQEKKIP